MIPYQKPRNARLPPLIQPLYDYVYSQPYPQEFGFTHLLDSTSQVDHIDRYAKVQSSQIDYAALAVDIGSLPMIISEAVRLNQSLPKPWVMEADQEIGLMVTALLILLHPKLPTSYKSRTDYITSQPPSIPFLLGELYLLNLAGTRSSKCSEMWHYRRDILGMLRSLNHDIDYSSELENASKCIEREPKNYYAWTHKVMVAQFLIKQIGNKDNMDLWDQAIGFCFSSPNDYSGINYLHNVGALALPPEEKVEVALSGFRERAELVPSAVGIWLGFRAVLDLAATRDLETFRAA
eukprot:CAMPEP_0118647332 /NCGR_PEP_ID=MMETSP0785-20121206/8546_1 /TAXON_ID=91992 /ORGANISM="Bolidomonas pacifica, Strain CCMP 1866" /LENGTH=292 /DNA_ID=CAMNT_0006539411 /DNA_START=28 /DNA_END=903 /DNA_ORIENTATION=-